MSDAQSHWVFFSKHSPKAEPLCFLADFEIVRTVISSFWRDYKKRDMTRKAKTMSEDSNLELNPLADFLPAAEETASRN